MTDLIEYIEKILSLYEKSETSVIREHSGEIDRDILKLKKEIIELKTEGITRIEFFMDEI